jgi:dienelactone hydrolase
MRSQFEKISLYAGKAILVAIVGLGGCGGDGRQGPGDVKVGLPAEDLADISEVVRFENARGETLIGVLALPESDEPLPAVIVLHGGGGLFAEPDGDDAELRLERQFLEWTSLLAAQGYAVLLPSSFYSRGFYDWNDRPDDLDKEDRLHMRVYDAHAALAFACNHARIDCDRVAALGFSNGGSAVVLGAHERLAEVDGMELLPPDDRRPRFRIGVAYYPGCGLHGLVSLSSTDPEKLYFPHMPLVVRHGENDSLVDDCEVRLAQTNTLTKLRGYEANPFQLLVYDDAGHGFDSAPRNSRERQARDQARIATLTLFAQELW